MTDTHLYLVPHMDDETISMGISVMRTAPASHLIFVTNGGPRYGTEFSFNKGYVSREHYMIVREAEAKVAGITLGVPEKNIQFLGITDQETQDYIKQLRDKIAT